MSFEKPLYMLVLLVLVLIFLVYRNRFYSKFFAQVKKFWFYNVTRSRRASNILYCLAFVALVIAVGDLRGKEEIIEGNIPTQKTLVVIDNSLSMLVEDIRPNRIKKSILMARHFLRNSYGHQVSIAVFSDIFKQIIPFTDDIDILEARLQILNDAKSEGGSNIGNTLSEAFQYFKTKDGYEKGNIIVFTDGEEHGDGVMNIPPEITVAVIAVGSENGGKIPLRSKDGQFQRYKKFNNEEVVSKIDKKFFTKLEKSGENVRIWFTQSYSLPTDEILNYLTAVHETSFQKGSFRQRPVKGIPLILLFITIYILSILLSRFKTFKIALFVCMLTMGLSNEANAQEDDKLNYYLEKYKNGEITKEEKLALAQLYMQKNENEKASSVYRSSIKDLDKEKPEDIFNFATSLLKEGKSADAMSLYKYIDKEREVSDELREVIKKNMLFAMNQEKKKNQSDESKEDEDKDEKKENKDKQEKKDKTKKKNQKNQKDQNKNKQNKSEDKNDSSDNKDKSENKDRGEQNKKNEQSDPSDKSDDKKEESEDSSDKKDDPKEEGKSFEEIKKEIELKKKNGVKGVLKQIMNDDANLQKLFINSSSKDNSDESKDW